MARFLLLLYAEAPVHAGADASVGDVDLPIQRESAAGLPVIWGQSLKGALRDHCARAWGPGSAELAAIFGDPPPQPGDPSPKPGCLAVGDAQLLAFPVPTLTSVFAWATSPLVLARLARKAGLCGVGTVPRGVPDTSEQAGAPADEWAGKAVLGPYIVAVARDECTRDWAEWLSAYAFPAGDEHQFFASKMATDLVAVPDDVMKGITEECVEITPRVQLHDRSDPEKAKTVKHGPFQVEYLPTETLLAALLECPSDTHAALLRDTVSEGRVLRLGGDETIGKGLLWCRFLGGAA